MKKSSIILFGSFVFLISCADDDSVEANQISIQAIEDNTEFENNYGE